MGAEAAALTLGTGGGLVLALEGIMGSLSAFGASMSWNPVGWICLAIVAVIAIVLLIVYWDEVCEWLSNLWNSFWNWFKATIVYEWIMDTAVPWISDMAAAIGESITAAWNTATSTAIPTTATKPYSADWAKPLVDAIVKATVITSSLIPDFNVYDLHVGKLGHGNDFRDYTRRKKGDPLENYVEYPLKEGDVYKYGITTFHSVEKRYVAFSWIPKEFYILKLIQSCRLDPHEWYAYHIPESAAKAIEASLIINYTIGHWGKFPPGNTGVY